MKQAYEKAKARVVLFDNSDVITTSGATGTNANGESCDSKKGQDCWTSGHGQGKHCVPNRSGQGS